MPDNEHQPQENIEVKTSPSSSRMMIGIFIFLLLGTLYIARTFLLPVFTALFLAYALLPSVNFLVRVHIPRILASAVVVLTTFLALSCLFIYLLAPALDLIDKVPRSLDKLHELNRMVDGPLSRVNKASEEIEKITKPEDGNEEMEVRLEEAGLGETLIGLTPLFVATVLSVFLLVFFALAFSETILSKMVEAAPDQRRKKTTVAVARSVEHSVSRYLATVTLINAGLGGVVGGLLYLLGFDDPVFWGFIAALFNFVPYLGAMAGVGFLAAASLIAGATIQEILLYPSVYLLCTVIEGNFVTPIILGRSFSVNPVFIILALLFLGWLWGVVGAVLAVPILITIMKAAETSESHKEIAILLGR